jgi:geranylgeranyl diphosphate synthase type I
MSLDFAPAYLAEVDTTMRRLVASALHDEAGFGVMVRYALGWSNADDSPHNVPTGKRLRPLLLLLCTSSAGGDWRTALPAASAVELLHNFSLIHDDIQDNSDLRHGRPTVWKQWGIANAINAGDAMFTLAYSALSALASSLEPARMVKLWRIFNATNLELTRGQHLDMRFEHQPSVSENDYISMIRGKSAALLATCAHLGALVAKDDGHSAAHYADFGMNIGIAFQIRDDILGIWGDPSVTGKSAATDILSRKKSLPALYGLAHSPEFARIYQLGTPLTEQDVAHAVALLDAIGARDYTIKQEQSYHDRAMRALNLAQPSTVVDEQLHAFVEFLFQRNY